MFSEEKVSLVHQSPSNGTNTQFTLQILRTLPSVGTLVQGNWVVQSEILYPPESVSGTNGVPAELMCRGRDYILYQFYRGEAIDRRKIAGVTLLPPDEIKELLLTVACFDRTTGWRLLQSPDTHFEEQNSELKQRQDTYWRLKDEMFAELESEAKSPRRKRKVSIREIKSEPSK